MSGLASAMALSTIPILLGLAWVLFIPFVIIYILERARASREGLQLHGLGAATIGSLMLSMSWQALLAGIAAFVSHAIDDLGDAAFDTAGGLAVGALVASVVPIVIVRHAAAAGAGRVIRSAVGVNAAISGLFSMAMTLALFVAWFNDGEKLGSMLATTLVYTVATVVTVRPLLLSDE